MTGDKLMIIFTAVADKTINLTKKCVKTRFRRKLKRRWSSGIIFCYEDD